MSSARRVLFPFLMWLLPLSFFTYQFILRLWPSLMMQPIMLRFGIDATAFGFLASVYYYGYAGMQIPIAIFLDKFGARRVVFVCALLCGFATFAFTYTENWYIALCSRFLVGIGSAAGFLATSKVISQWFDKTQYAKMVGFTFTVGLMGAIYGGKPVSLLVERFGWQDVATVLACVSLTIGILSAIFLRAPQRAALEKTEEPFQFKDLLQLLRSRPIWFLGIANLLMVGSLEGFADVWGVNYLMSVYDLAKSEAAGLVSFIFVGMIFGGPILATISKRFGHCRVIMCCGFGMAALLMQLLLGDHAFNWYALAASFFMIGLLCCYQVLVFAVGDEMVSRKMLGVTVAFLNCINMLGGSFFHSTIGLVMDVVWTGEMDVGLRHYTPDSYEVALLVVPACAILGALIVAGVGRYLKNNSQTRNNLV